MKIDIVLGYAQGRGGLEDVITRVSSILSDKKHKVRIFQKSEPQFKEWCKTLPSIEYYGMKSDSNEDEFQLMAKGYNKKLIETYVPDIIIATHTPILSYICHKAVESMGEYRPPIISWIHSMPEYFGAVDCLKYADAHLAISTYIGESIKKTCNNNSEVYYVGNPSNINEYKDIKQSREKMKYLYVGRLSNHEKRLDVLFNALSLIEDDFEYELDIIGDGQDRAYLENLAIELNIEKNINWRGWIENPWDHVDKATALILSSDFEGCPMILIEALGRGIPVVATDCSGVEDTIENDKNGWILKKGNYGQLYKILNNIYIGKNALPKSEDCKISVQKFESENVVNKIETVLMKYNSEFEYEREKLKFQNLILSFINNNDFEQARTFISSYENIFGKDEKYYNMISEILIKDKNYKDAYDSIKKGLLINSSNIELLAKLAMLNLEKEENIKAIEIYYRILNLCNDIKINDDIITKINEIYMHLMNIMNVDIALEYDKLNIPKYINNKIFERFIIKKSKVYEFGGYIDNAILGYKNVAMYSEDMNLKEYAISRIHQIYSYIESTKENYSKNENLVSVIIPSYNNMQYIYQTIDSVLNQTYEDIELVVSDNATIDFNVDEIKSYIEKNKKENIKNLIVYKNNINIGLVSNYNKAISKSNGKYIKFIGSDDIFYNEFVLEKMIKRMEESKQLIIFSNSLWCDINMNEYWKSKQMLELYRNCLTYLKKDNEIEKLYNIMKKENVVSEQGVLFNRDIFYEYGLFDEEYFLLNDYPYWMKLMKLGCKIDYMDIISIRYRAGSGVSTSGRINKEWSHDLNKFDRFKSIEYK